MIIRAPYPDVASGMRLWTPSDSANPPASNYDALDTASITMAGNRVSAMTDRGTGGNNVSQATSGNQPAYNATGNGNGKPAIMALASGQKLTSTSWVGFPAGTTSGMIIGVMSVTPDTGANYPGVIIYGNPATAQTREIDAQAFSSRLYGTTFGSDGNSGVDSGSVDRIVAVVFESGQIKTYIDGTLVLTINVAFNTAAGPLRLLDAGVMRFSQMMVIAGLADRQKFEGYLAGPQRWAMQGQLLAGHPYKTTPPMVPA